jgi:hypothetical protein
MNGVVGLPTEAPSRRRLLITTAGAVAVASAIVVAFVMPAEYGIDPLGTGRLLGLTAMGAPAGGAEPATPPPGEALEPAIEGPVAHYGRGYKTDAVTLELGPYEYVEYKYRLEQGASMMYSWTATTELIHEFHADPDGTPAPEPVTYDTRNRRQASGTLTAPFPGIHGWYWENAGNERVTISLVSSGFYGSAVEMRSNRRRRVHELSTPAPPSTAVPE